jgi:hypothetical protein
MCALHCWVFLLCCIKPLFRSFTIAVIDCQHAHTYICLQLHIQFIVMLCYLWRHIVLNVIQLVIIYWFWGVYSQIFSWCVCNISLRHMTQDAVTRVTVCVRVTYFFLYPGLPRTSTVTFPNRRLLPHPVLLVGHITLHQKWKSQNMSYSAQYGYFGWPLAYYETHSWYV